MRRVRLLLSGCMVLFGAVSVNSGTTWRTASAATLPAEGGASQPSPTARGFVVVAPINGAIDLGIAPFVERALRDATRDRAKAVILEINTFGGRLDAAVVVRDALLSAQIPTVAFINRRAISAGALIALAAERIVIADGGTIGAATPVQVGSSGAPPAPVSEKSISYVRKEFRSTAEVRGRPMRVAEAMVDVSVEIEGVTASGKLLTLTTTEALELRVADFRANSIAAVLDSLGLAGAEIRTVKVNWAENLVRLMTNPVVASLLLSVGLVGILVEIRTPGFGVPGLLGLTSFAVYLGGHWIVRLAGWEELSLVAVGIVLILVEVLVIPGFGVAGVAGISALLGGLTLTLVGDGASTEAIAGAVGRVTMSLLGALVLGLLAMRVMTRSPFGRRLVLESELDAGDGWESTPEADHHLLGAVGRTHTSLRPAGIADMAGARVDVVSDGELIESGTDVIVTRVDGNRVVVRRYLITKASE